MAKLLRRLSIGPFSLVLDSPGESVSLDWGSILPGWQDVSKAPIEEAIVVRVTGTPGLDCEGSGNPASNLLMTVLGDEVVVRANGIRGHIVLDQGTTSADFELSSPAISLWAALRLSLTCATLRRPLLLLHASGVRLEGRVFIFLGPSGAGKTTVATALKGTGHTFSLDRVLVEQTNTGWIGHGTPLSDPEHLWCAEPAPIAGLFFLEQSDSISLRPLGLLEATRSVMTCLSTYPRHPAFDGHCLALATELCKSVPAFSLAFRRDDQFWPLILRPHGQGNQGGVST